MSLRLFLAAPGNALLEFDAAGVPDDLGVEIIATAETHPQDVGSADGERRLRALTQWVHVGDACQVEVVPVMDGVPRLDQQTTLAVQVANGVSQRIEAPVSAMGRRFGMRVTARGGVSVALGQAALTVVPRRSQTGGR
jgi:hypothetical protein